MRTSFKAALFVAASALLALQVAQPASGHLVDREVFEDVTPVLYDYQRRQDAATPVSSSTAPTASATAGSSCSANADCASNECSGGKCIPADGTGENSDYCTGDVQCVSGSYCYRGSCASIKSNGSNCYKDSGCESGQCVNKKCVGVKGVSRGDSCTRSIQCKTGYCGNSKCTSFAGVGQYCYKNQGCDTNNCVNNKCKILPTKKIGQSCSTGGDSVCRSGFCSKNVCAAKRGRGRGCNKNSACSSGTCRKSGTCK